MVMEVSGLTLLQQSVAMNDGYQFLVAKKSELLTGVHIKCKNIFYEYKLLAIAARYLLVGSSFTSSNGRTFPLSS